MSDVKTIGEIPTVQNPDILLVIVQLSLKKKKMNNVTLLLAEKL